MGHFWLALMIGNSRLHWALFQGDDFVVAWNTPHLNCAQVQQLVEQRFAPPAWASILESPLPQMGLEELNPATNSAHKSLPLWLASVVPSQTALWQTYAGVHPVNPHQLPIGGLYPTLGSDRILALWGAGTTWDWPILVIDGGTALTLTAATPDRNLLGGAILPGLRLQFQALSQQTAALPPVSHTHDLPPRWATTTPTAIQSGILYTVMAGLRDYLQDWWQRYPGGAVTLTGGDGLLLFNYLKQKDWAIAPLLHHDPHVIFKGIWAYRAWSQVWSRSTT